MSYTPNPILCHPISVPPEGPLCYNRGTYIDTSLSSRARGFHYGSYLVLYILWGLDRWRMNVATIMVTYIVIPLP